MEPMGSRASSVKQRLTRFRAFPRKGFEANVGEFGGVGVWLLSLGFIGFTIISTTKCTLSVL